MVLERILFPLLRQGRWMDGIRSFRPGRESKDRKTPTEQGDLSSPKEVLWTYQRTSNLGQISGALSGCGSAGHFSYGEGSISTFKFFNIFGGEERVHEQYILTVENTDNPNKQNVKCV